MRIEQLTKKREGKVTENVGTTNYQLTNNGIEKIGSHITVDDLEHIFINMNSVVVLDETENVLDEETNKNRGVNSHACNRGTYFLGFDVDSNDNSYEQTLKLLNELGVCVFFSYQTHSYTPELTKHRVIAKFNRYVSIEEEKLLIELLKKWHKTKLSLGGELDRFGKPVTYFDATTFTPNRLWYGGKKAIEKKAELTDFDQLLEKVKVLVKAIEDSKPKVQRKSKQVKVNEIKTTSKQKVNKNNIDTLDLYGGTAMNYFEAMVDLYESEGNYWNDFRLLAIYVAVRIFEDMADATYVDYLKNYNYSSDHSNNPKKEIARAKALKLGAYAKDYKKFINTFFKKEDNFNVFSIKPEQVIKLDHGEYVKISPELIQPNTSMAVFAPAGLGKTTELLKILQDKVEKSLFVVPTVALLDDLYNKYHLNTLFGFKSGQRKENLDAKILIITTDQFDSVYGADVHKFIVLDEFHTAAEMFLLSMKEKEQNRRLNALLQADKCIILTASPYNLPNVFKNVLWFQTDLERLVYYGGIIQIDKIQKCINDQINEAKANNNSRPVFAYVNSIKYQQKLNKRLSKDGRKVLLIESNNVEEIFKNDLAQYDVIFTTKSLNLGVDFWSRFSSLIFTGYGDSTINGLIQFLNRDRDQSIPFIFFSAKPYNNFLNRINDKVQIVDSPHEPHIIDELNKGLTHNGKSLNYTYINDIYKNIKLSYEQLVYYVRDIHPNFDPIMLDIYPEVLEDEDGAYLPQYLKRSFRGDLERYIVYKETPKIKTWIKSEGYNKLTRSQRDKIFFIIQRIYYFKLDFTLEYIEANFKFFSDMSFINDILMDEVLECFKELYMLDYVSKEKRDNMIATINNNVYHAQGKPANATNFVSICREYGVYLKSDKDQNKNVKGWRNVTVRLDVKKDISDEDFFSFHNKSIAECGFIIEKDLTKLRKLYCKKTGLSLTNNSFSALFNVELKRERMRIDGVRIWCWVCNEDGPKITAM